MPQFHPFTEGDRAQGHHPKGRRSDESPRDAPPSRTREKNDDMQWCQYKQFIRWICWLVMRTPS